MSGQNREVSGFQRALEVWNRRKWLATVVFIVTLAGSLSMVWSLPPMYRSSATVLVDRTQVPETFVRAAVTGELEPRLDTISQEVLSRTRLEDVITRFDLYPAVRKRESAAAAVEQMRKDIQFAAKATEQPGKATTIAFTLSYRGFDPGTVARVTNALASYYVQENLNLRERQATGTAQFLKTQLDEMKKRLEEEERTLGTQPLTVEAQLASLERLNTQLKINSDRQLRLLDQRERLMKGMDVVETPGGGGAALGGTETVAARIARLKQQLTELQTRYSDKYPDVINTKAEIAALERRQAQEPEAAQDRSRPRQKAAQAGKGKDPLNEIAVELTQLKEAEKTLRQAIATAEQRLDSAPKRQQEYQRQARDYSTLKEQYQSVLKRYVDAQEAERMEQGRKGEQFRILDAALPPKEPVAPARFRLELVGLIFSLGLSAASVVLAEALDGSFHSVDELRVFSKVPVVAGIPRLVTEADRLRRIRRNWLVALALLVILALVAGAAYLFAHRNEDIVRVLSVASGPMANSGSGSSAH